MIYDLVPVANVENVENVETHDNVENVENDDNVGNVENVENVENVANVANVDNRYAQYPEVLEVTFVGPSFRPHAPHNGLATSSAAPQRQALMDLYNRIPPQHGAREDRGLTC